MATHTLGGTLVVVATLFWTVYPAVDDYLDRHVKGRVLRALVQMPLTFVLMLPTAFSVRTSLLYFGVVIASALTLVVGVYAWPKHRRVSVVGVIAAAVVLYPGLGLVQAVTERDDRAKTTEVIVETSVPVTALLSLRGEGAVNRYEGLYVVFRDQAGCC